MASIRFDTYYRYEPLVGLLHELAREHPDLVRLHSIGKSHEGRDIWLAEVTAFATGEPPTSRLLGGRQHPRH